MDILPIVMKYISKLPVFPMNINLQSGLVLQFTVAYFGKHQRNNSIDLPSPHDAKKLHVHVAWYIALQGPLSRSS